MIYLEAMAVATPFGGNPSTILLWNGQLGQVPGYLCAGSSGEVPALLAQGLWAWETGAPWQVSKVQPLRGTSRVARYLEGVRWAWEQQMNQSMLMAMGRPGDQFQSWREVLGLWAAQGASGGRPRWRPGPGGFSCLPPPPPPPTAPFPWRRSCCTGPPRPWPERRGRFRG